MYNFTFLTIDQIFGHNKLDIIKKRGSKAYISDFAIVLGGYSSYNCNTNSDNLTGCYWTKTLNETNDVLIINYNGDMNQTYFKYSSLGCRPVLEILNNNIPINSKGGKIVDGVLEVEYGCYPERIAPEQRQKLLEQVYKTGNLTVTGNIYTVNEKEFIEYQFNKKRYVRVQIECYSTNCKLSDGKTYNKGDYIWIEVNPIKWWVDLKEQIMIAEKIMFSGVQFSESNVNDFNDTKIKKIMEEYFAHEIVQSGCFYDKLEIDNLEKLNYIRPEDEIRIDPMVYTYMANRLYKVKEGSKNISHKERYEVLKSIIGDKKEDFEKFCQQEILSDSEINTKFIQKKLLKQKN